MIFQSAMEPGVAVGLDACQWNEYKRFEELLPYLLKWVSLAGDSLSPTWPARPEQPCTPAAEGRAVTSLGLQRLTQSYHQAGARILPR